MTTIFIFVRELVDPLLGKLGGDRYSHCLYAGRSLHAAANVAANALLGTPFKCLVVYIATVDHDTGKCNWAENGRQCVEGFMAAGCINSWCDACGIPRIMIEECTDDKPELVPA